MTWRLIGLLAMLAALAVWAGGAASLADPAWWAQQLQRCEHWCATHPVAFTLGYVLLFALLSAVTLPGCSVLALAAGPIFGATTATLLLGAASTLGALGPFLMARHIARDAAQARFGHRLRTLEAMLSRGRGWALFGLRVVPLIPFPVLNPLLGLTRMPLRDFLLPSFAGLTLASVPWVWLGEAARQAWSPDRSHAGLLAAAALSMLAGTWWLHRRLAREPRR